MGLKSLRGYYASISFMDAQVGILIEALDRLKLSDETIVVFISDHGYHTAHHGMWHKETLFEQSARVPLIIVAPGKARGAVSSRVVELLDLYPTLAKLSGFSAPEALQGQSLVPLLEDPKASWPGAAVTIEGRTDEDGRRTFIGRSIRTERYRYTEWEEGRRGVELYDHTADPDEFVNLARKPESSEVVEKLRLLLRSRLDR